MQCFQADGSPFGSSVPRLPSRAGAGGVRGAVHILLHWQVICVGGLAADKAMDPHSDLRK